MKADFKTNQIGSNELAQDYHTFLILRAFREII